MIEKQLDELVKELPVFKDNMEFLKKLITYLSTPIETQNPSILRSQISDAYSFMAFLVRLKTRSEASYRIAQKEAAETSSKEFKAIAREAMLKGSVAQYSFARDLLEGYLDTLNSKLSASKAILYSIDQELKKIPND